MAGTAAATLQPGLAAKPAAHRNDHEDRHENEGRQSGKPDFRADREPDRPAGLDAVGFPGGREGHESLDPAHASADTRQDLFIGRLDRVRHVRCHRQISGFLRSVAQARATSERTPEALSPRISPIAWSSMSRW